VFSARRRSLLREVTVVGVIVTIGAMSNSGTVSASSSSLNLIEAASATLPPRLASPLRLLSRGLALPAEKSTATRAARPSNQPADLVALERKMQTLHINSEQAVAEVYVSGPHLGQLFGLVHGKHPVQKRSHGHVELLHTSLPQAPKQTIPLLTLDVETSISPKLAAIRAVLLGIPIQAREIGEQLYTRSPLLTQNDGGRPWIYESPAEQAEARANQSGEGEASLFPQLGSASGEEGGFRKMAEELAHARSAVEIGPKTVDGQQTTEFEVVPATEQLLGKRPARGRSKRKQEMPHTKMTLDVYLAVDGLPVAMRFHIVKGSDAVVIATDILATEIPIPVQPPPASETITRPELEKLHEKEAGAGLHPPTKQEEAEERRFVACARKRLGKHPSKASRRKLRRTFHECERIAKRGAKR
jgi:hypothetical protein